MFRTVFGHRWATQALPKGENPPKKDHGYCMVVSYWCDSLQFSTTGQNHHSRVLLWGKQQNVPKIASAAASTGQQKRSDPAPQQRPSARLTNYLPKIKRIERWSSVSPTISRQPTTIFLNTITFSPVKPSPIRTRQKRPSSTSSNSEHPILMPTELIDLYYVDKSALIRMSFISIKLNKYSLRYYSLK